LNDGSKQQLTIYYIPVNKRSKTQFNQAGERVLYDVDRYYATSDNNKEVIMIQEYVFGKVLNTFDEMRQLAINRPKNRTPKQKDSKKPNQVEKQIQQEVVNLNPLLIKSNLIKSQIKSQNRLKTKNPIL